MATDWLKATNKQRVDLYDAVVRLINLGELTWAELYGKALGTPSKNVSGAFNENFRKGKISKIKANKIYKYLVRDHSHAVPAINVAASTAREFQEFLLYYRRLGAVQILPELIGTSHRVNRLGPEWHEYPFEIADPVCFRLRLPHVYRAVCALNWTNEGWYPIALAEPSDYELADLAPPEKWKQRDPFIKPVTQGAQTICTLPPTEGERKRRRYDNSFVFLMGDYPLLKSATSGWSIDQPFRDADLDRIAELFRSERQSGWSVTLINAHGIGPIED